MRKGSLMRRRILISCMTLMPFLLTACRTTEDIPETEAVHPPLPEPAVIRSVEFADAPELGGLVLTYEDYRALRHNIIEYRREIADLRDTLAFYRETE